MSRQIVFTGNALPESQKKALEDKGFAVKIDRFDLSEDELIESLQGASGLMLGGVEKITRRVLEACPQLRIVAFFGVGYENYIDANACSDFGVAVTNCPGANARSVAEFTMALMLDAIKRVSYLNANVKAGGWTEYKSWEMQGKTLAIIGMGAIGSTVARIAKQGFGMQIVYTARNPKPDIDKEFGARFLPLDEALKAADVISLHANTTEETKNMIGKAQLALVKPTAVLIDTARPELVDAVALKAALFDRKLGCAAFDGYYTEHAMKPEDDHFGLLSLPDNLFLVTPHSAFFTDDAVMSIAEMASQSIIDFFEDKPDSNVVNPKYAENAKKLV